MLKENFPALTGIRAISAYMVFLYHLISFRDNIFPPQIFDILNEFHVGVTMFFVLSGFLITHRYYETINFDFKQYIRNRFARIYPMYFVLTSITFLYTIFFYDNSIKTLFKVYITSITFTRSFFKDYIFGGIAQGWSLTVEEMFYFCAPLFFFLLKKSKIYLIIIPVVLISFGFLLERIFGGYDIYGFMKSDTFILDFTFFGRISEFMIGIALSLFVNKFKNKLKTKHVTFFGISMISCFIYFLSIINAGDGTEIGIVSYWGKLINNLLLPLLGIAPLYWGLITEETCFSKILSTRLFLLLGSSSYMFYLIHAGVFSEILLKMTDNLFIIWILLNLLAIILYKYAETPLNNYFRNLKYSSISSSRTVN
jgi:peptidoglycan/LPS O-acetylase OafA/YrhL